MMNDFNDSANNQKPGGMFRAFLGDALNDENRMRVEQHKLADQLDEVFDKVGQLAMVNTRAILEMTESVREQLDGMGLEGPERTEALMGFLAHNYQNPGIVIDDEKTCLALRSCPVEQLQQLPGFMKMHLTARMLDVAVTFDGIDGSYDMTRPIAVQVDFTRSYEEGKALCPQFYPELPSDEQMRDNTRRTMFGNQGVSGPAPQTPAPKELGPGPAPKGPKPKHGKHQL